VTAFRYDTSTGRTARRIKFGAALAAALAGAAGVHFGVASGQNPSPRISALPRGAEPVHLDPRDFSANIDNHRWPMTVGSRWVYRVVDSSDGSVKREVITVTGQTKMMADGIEARVVHDVVREHGKPVEVTDDWYAQDKHGNVWYFGEDTIEYVNGRPRDNGSWEAGVDGNMPGVALPARPSVGLTYREEYSNGVAEDQSRVLVLDEQAEVPAGHYRPVLMTEDFSPIERRVSELKFYAKGSGQAVLAVDVSGGSEREELVKYTRPRLRASRPSGRRTSFR
jgi:hypothetical protein